MSISPIECWFDFGSNYSYIAISRIQPLARAMGVQIVWRPLLLGQIFQRLGWETSPFVLQKEKGEYAFMDTARQCAKYGVPWKQPTTFPRPAVYTMRVAAAYAEEVWVGDYCQRVMRLNFAEDRDINSNDVAIEVLNELGLDGKSLVEGAQAPAAKARLREFGDLAVARKIFGAPTFFVEGEMFWGNDRLEDALAKATQYRGVAPRSAGPYKFES